MATTEVFNPSLKLPDDQLLQGITGTGKRLRGGGGKGREGGEGRGSNCKCGVTTGNKCDSCCELIALKN